MRETCPQPVYAWLWGQFPYPWSGATASCDGDRRSISHSRVPWRKKGAYRRSVLHLNLVSVVNGSTLIWCEQNALRKSMGNERKMTMFSESTDPCFVHRRAAVLQYTQFVFVDESTRRRMSNAATPKPGRFEEEWAKLDLAPTAMRGKIGLQDAALIVLNMRLE